MRSVYVCVTARERDVVVTMSLTGFENVENAKRAIIGYLREEGADGDAAGGIEEVTERPNGNIAVMTNKCGFGISEDDIKRALLADGREIVCG